MDAVSSQPVSPNVLRARARAGVRNCAKGIEVRSKSVSAKRNSRSSTHSLFKRVLRSEIAQRGCVGPDATPHDLGDNPIRSEFNYTLENRQRTKLEETFYFDHDGDGGQTTPDVAKTTTYDWDYDTNDRLLSETIDHHDNALDRTESFVMDLFGNRTNRTVDYVDPTAADQAFAYSYDDNDRLTTETLDDNADSTVDTTTRYSWDSTQQTAKEIFTGDSTAPADLVSSQTFNYDLQGRLAEVITSPETGPATKVTYSYDSSGIRVSSSKFTDANSNGIFETSELDHTIEYLVDHRNHTGYAQTIVETTRDSSDVVTKRVAYTFGSDELTQTVTDYTNGVPEASPDIHHFGHDVHGSVRTLLDSEGEIEQSYLYAADGDLLAIYDADGNLVGILGASEVSDALTSLLYSGESFDSRIGQQYLRARWYDPASGRFSRLDPFGGHDESPLFHNKYLYTNANPIALSDPSGLFGVSATLGSISVGNSLSTVYNDAAMGIGESIATELLGQQVYMDPVGLALHAAFSALGQGISFASGLLSRSLWILEAGIFIDSFSGGATSIVSEAAAMAWASGGINNPVNVERRPTSQSGLNPAAMSAVSVSGVIVKVVRKGGRYPVKLLQQTGRKKLYVGSHSMLGKFNKKHGIDSNVYQRHHISQDAAFGPLGIPYGQGLAVNLKGSTAAKLQHHDFHKHMDAFWSKFRGKPNARVTVAQYNRELKKVLKKVGFSPEEAAKITELAKLQQQAYKITDSTIFKHIPNPSV